VLIVVITQPGRTWPEEEEIMPWMPLDQDFLIFSKQRAM
jgi:hypothetical protein